MHFPYSHFEIHGQQRLAAHLLSQLHCGRTCSKMSSSLQKIGLDTAQNEPSDVCDNSWVLNGSLRKVGAPFGASLPLQSFFCFYPVFGSDRIGSESCARVRLREGPPREEQRALRSPSRTSPRSRPWSGILGSEANAILITEHGCSRETRCEFQQRNGMIVSNLGNTSRSRKRMREQ